MKAWLPKYLVIGTFLLLALISYLLISKEQSNPTTKVDCLKLGSDARAKACLELLNTTEQKEVFPIEALQVNESQVKWESGCLLVSGNIKNISDSIADSIMLRINFTKDQSGNNQFHYQVFSPFSNLREQIQPQSSKSFSECLSGQTTNAVKDVQGWYYTISPYQAKVGSRL